MADRQVKRHRLPAAPGSPIRNFLEHGSVTKLQHAARKVGQQVTNSKGGSRLLAPQKVLVTVPPLVHRSMQPSTGAKRRTARPVRLTGSSDGVAGLNTEEGSRTVRRERHLSGRNPLTRQRGSLAHPMSEVVAADGKHEEGIHRSLAGMPGIPEPLNMPLRPAKPPLRLVKDHLKLPGALRGCRQRAATVPGAAKEAQPLDDATAAQTTAKCRTR